SHSRRTFARCRDPCRTSMVLYLTFLHVRHILGSPSWPSFCFIPISFLASIALGVEGSHWRYDGVSDIRAVKFWSAITASVGIVWLKCDGRATMGHRCQCADRRWRCVAIEEFATFC